MRIRRGGPDDAAAVLASGQVFVMRLGHQPGTAAR